MNAGTSDPRAPGDELSEAEVEELLFDAASVFSSAEERERFLAFACRGEPKLRERIRRLLRVQSHADEFFEFEPQVKAGEGDEGSGGAPDDGGGGDGLGVEVERYRLIERIGAGGCGVVYLAEQLEPVRRKVALKIIRLGLENPESVARFEAERQALASMNHPYIARVLDAGTNASGRPFFVMELVDGEPVTEYCNSRKMGIRGRLGLFVRICQAIQHAHQKGVVHRDIKPSNVLVESHGSTPDPKVIDFGIAQEGEVVVQQAGEGLVGTPVYMSPEQVSGEHAIDTRSDIYSLGMLLSELLVGPPNHLPSGLMDRDPEERRRILVESNPAPPSKVLASRPADERRRIGRERDVPIARLAAWCLRDLDWVVRKATHRDPSRRYETATALGADVTRWLGGEPVNARPQTRRYRLAKLISRNRLLYGAGALALAGLIGGLGAATVLFLREKQARAAEASSREQAEAALLAEMRIRKRWEYRSRVAEAAVRLRYGDMEGAREQVESIPLDEAPPSLEAVSVYQELAEWHRSHGRDEAAADAFLAMVDALSKTDRMHTDNNSNYFLPAAAALADSSDPGHYERMRTIALDLYGDTGNRLVAERILKASLLKPADAAILERTAKLAAVLEGEASGNGDALPEAAGLNGWECFALGLHDYRAASYGRARAWTQLSMDRADDNQASRPSANALLGLIHQKLGEPAEAMHFLTAAETAAGERLSGVLPYGTMRSGFWYDWRDLRTLLEEAGWSEGEGWPAGRD